MNCHRKTLVSGAITAAGVLALGAGTAAGAAAPSASSPSAGQTPTVHTATARVGATTETILVDAKGFPLYYFAADTAKKSKVNSQLAQLWPPLVAARPTASGVSGKVSR